MLLSSLEDLLDLMASTNLYHRECRCIAGNWKVTDIGKKSETYVRQRRWWLHAPTPYWSVLHANQYRTNISKSFINLIILYFNYSLCCYGCDIYLMKVLKVHVMKNRGACVCDFFLMWLSFIRSVLLISHIKYCWSRRKDGSFTEMSFSGLIRYGQSFRVFFNQTLFYFQNSFYW